MSEESNVLTDKLKKWVEKIMLEEVLPMLETRSTMVKLRDLLNFHPPEIQVDDLAEALQYSYVGSMVMSVCRQTDRDTRTMSLLNLLNKILDHPDIFTRDWYLEQGERHNKIFDGVPYAKVATWEDRTRTTTEFHAVDEKGREEGLSYTQFSSEFADPFFDECGHLKVVNVRNDLDRLQKDTRIIQGYRNRFIAHSEKGARAKVVPRFHDLDKAINIIRNLTTKYCGLLCQASMDTDLAHLDDDWINLILTKK